MNAAQRLWSTLLRLGQRAGFECQTCGKVFDARQRRVLCPECDSADVSMLTE
jgi:Zn finger protein HypA/HybF involved in hydrogenase expression